MQRPSGILVVALLAALLSGCAAEPSPDATPTPTFTSEADAFAAAEATYRAYVDALNQVDLADPETFEAVYAWTTGELNSRDRRNLSKMHADAETVSGDSNIVSIDLVAADVDNGEVELAVCVDVSAVAVTDSTGKSVVDPNRVNIQSIAVDLRRSVTTETHLAISTIVGRDGEPKC